MVAGADDIRAARFDLATVSALIPDVTEDEPIALFRRDALRRRAEMFKRGFSGHVSYAVKANPSPDVLRILVQSGVTTFDVASVAEMRAVRAVLPTARLHYHNPVRSAYEIAEAARLGARSWSVDRMSELDKLGVRPDIEEIAVRVALDRSGAAYNFGSKFGASPETATDLLKAVAARGMTPSLTFHPGTQCTDASAWRDYILRCSAIAQNAGVTLRSLNVGGGFPAAEQGKNDALREIFVQIDTATIQSFASAPPVLWCEPGRAMVSDAYWLLLQIKARNGDTLFLNDGLYGALGEWRDMPVPGQKEVFDRKGHLRQGQAQQFTLFGPTCDSLDVLPAPWILPADSAEGDHILVQGAGAYSLALVTGFNGYGTRRVVDLATLTNRAGQSRLAG